MIGHALTMIVPLLQLWLATLLMGVVGASIIMVDDIFYRKRVGL